MNLLSQRIKEAKRELTNLKTAHKRGLGLLKVYVKDLNISPPTGQESVYWLIVDVEVSVSNYPFLQCYAYIDSDEDIIVEGSRTFTYNNGGYGARFGIPMWRLQPARKISVYSTSPIDSVNYSWSLYG